MSSKPLKGDDFIHLPEYPGGKSALQQFIKDNLTYPEQALKNRTAGTVLVGFRIGYNGSVSEVKILKGIGDGCDEEAVRVVKKLHFSQQANRGVKLTSSKKMKIHFHLPEVSPPTEETKFQVSYELKSIKKHNEKNKPVKSYSYTVNINN